MNDITTAQLAAIMTGSDAPQRAAQWIAALNDSMRACAIDTPLRQSAFLAQVLMESGELRQVQESLGYSAQRLHVVWPKHFPSLELAEAYSHNPQKLADHVYANRMGNGDEASGDGWNYRGRGLIQLTGRAGYERFSRDMGIDAVSNPDLLQEPSGAALAAAWFWRSHGLNELADQTGGDGDDDRHYVDITRRINGGTAGLQQRRDYWLRARHALGVSAH